MTTGSEQERPIRILIVDDHALVAESLRRALDREPGFEPVAVAVDAVGAVAAAREHRPDVVLMDYALPESDGVEVARSVLSEVSSARVLLLTGSSGQTIVQSAIEAGCVGYLDKSATIPDLFGAIRRAHSGDLVLAADDLQLILTRRSSAEKDSLTNREVEVLRLMAEGLSNRSIADRLVISVDTVRTHVQRILAKLDSHSRLAAVAEGRKRKILS